MKAKKPALRVVEKVTPISTKSKSGDSWTPLQLLESFVTDVKAGKTVPEKIMLHWMEANPNGTSSPRRWQAGCSRSEEIAFCELAKLMAMEDWKA